jgi:uncharacterized membrane protein
MTNKSKKSNINNSYLALVGTVIAGVLLLSAAGIFSLSSAQPQGQGLEQQDQLELLLGNFASQNDPRTAVIIIAVPP